MDPHHERRVRIDEGGAARRSIVHWARQRPSGEAVLKGFIWIIPALLLSSAVAAQEARERPSPPRVPGSFTPPAGLCRLWIDGVPASQQPAPTDCANAIRNRPSNAAVVFGPPRRSEPMEMEPFARRSGKVPVRQLAPDTRARGNRDDSVRDEPRAREGPRARTSDTTAKPVRRKPEMPQ